MTLLAGSALAQDPQAEKTTTTTSTVSAEPAKSRALTPDSVTDGTVTVGGKPIAYKAVAGLLRVGGTDQTDATIALDGTQLPDSGAEPPKPGDEPATATHVLHRLLRQRREYGHPPHRLHLQRRPRLRDHVPAHGQLRPRARRAARPRPPCRRPLQDRSQRRLAPRRRRPRLHRRSRHRLQPRHGQGRQQVLLRHRRRTPAPSTASSAASSPSTIAGTRPASSSAKATAPRATRCWAPRCSGTAST